MVPANLGVRAIRKDTSHASKVFGSVFWCSTLARGKIGILSYVIRFSRSSSSRKLASIEFLALFRGGGKCDRHLTWLWSPPNSPPEPLDPRSPNPITSSVGSREELNMARQSAEAPVYREGAM